MRVILGTGRDADIDPTEYSTVGELAAAAAAQAGLTEGTFSLKVNGVVRRLSDTIVVIDPEMTDTDVVELVDVSNYTWPDVETEEKVGDAIDGERTQVGPTHAPDGEMHDLADDGRDDHTVSL